MAEMAPTLPEQKESIWRNPDAPVVEGVHPQAQMWSELRRLVKIGADLELADKLPPRPSHFMTLVNSIRDDHPPVPDHGWRGLRMRDAKLACAAMQYLAGVAEQEDTSELADGIWKGATAIDSTAPVLDAGMGLPGERAQSLLDQPPGGEIRSRDGKGAAEGLISKDGTLTLRCPPEASPGMLLKVLVRRGTNDSEVMSIVVPKGAKPGQPFTLTEKQRKRSTKKYHDDMKRILKTRHTDAPSRTIDRWDPLAATSGKSSGESLSSGPGSAGPVAPELSKGWDGLDPFRTLASLDKQERLERMKERGELLTAASGSSEQQQPGPKELAEAQLEAKKKAKKKKKRDRQKKRKAELAAAAAFEDPILEENTPPQTPSPAPAPLKASASDYFVPDE
jgi:hypothetical protein